MARRRGGERELDADFTVAGGTPAVQHRRKLASWLSAAIPQAWRELEDETAGAWRRVEKKKRGSSAYERALGEFVRDYSESEVDFWNLYYSLGLIVFVVVLAGVIITAYFLWRTFERTPHVRARRASSGDSGEDDEDDEDDEGGVEVLGAEDLEEALKDDKSVLIGELEDLEGYLSEAEEELEEEDKRKRKKKKKDHGRHRKKKKKHRDVATGTDSDISYLKPKPKKER